MKSAKKNIENIDNITVLTFDCYGTLIDWERGILNAVSPILMQEGETIHPNEILGIFAETEANYEAGEYKSYREILELTAGDIIKRYNVKIPGYNFLADSVRLWQPFSDTNESMPFLKEHFKIGLVSNIDNDLLTGTLKHFEFDFDFIVTSEDTGSYKPSEKNFLEALKKSGAGKDQILHVAQSLYHDIKPAAKLGISNVWINRRHSLKGGGATKNIVAFPDIEFPNLKSFVSFIKKNRDIC